MGRQHHRGAGRSWQPRSGSPAVDGAFATAALFAATHPSRTTALVVLEGYARSACRATTDGLTPEEIRGAMVAMWGTGEFQHVVNPDMPWNEEIRATWARMERLAASPATVALMMPLVSEMDVRAVLPTVRVPTLVVHHSDDALITPAMGKYVADHIPGAKYVELPGRNMYHFVEPWRESFQEIAEFLTGHQAEVADDRVLATVLFTDIVDSTRRAAEIGDRDWHALLDAHDAVVRCATRSVSRPRGEHIGRRLPRDVRRPAASDPLRHGNSRRRAGAGHRGARRIAHRRVRAPRRRHRRHRRAHRRARQRARRSRTTCWCPARCATSSSGQGSSSTTAAPTNSRACPANGTCSPSLRGLGYLQGAGTRRRAFSAHASICLGRRMDVRLRPTGSDPPAPRKAGAYRRIRHRG